MACLFHEKPFAGRERLGQARQLLDRQRDPGQPARSRRHAARQRAVPGVLRRGHPRRPQVRRAAARGGGVGGERPSPRRQRGAAGDHLDLPRRAARPTSSSRSRRAAPPARRARARSPSASTRCRRCRRTPATATAPARSPSPATASSSAPSALGQSIAGPMVAINTILAESLDYIATKLEAAVASDSERASTPRSRRCSRRSSPSTAASIFNGDGYSEAWHEEAKKRGLAQPAHRRSTRCRSSATPR